MAKSGGNHSKAPKGPINTHISIQSQRSNCSLAPPLSPGLPVGPCAISFSCVSTGFRGAVVSYVHNLLTIAHKRKLWWPQRSTTLIGAHTKLTTRPLACNSPQPPRCGGARALFTTCIAPCIMQCIAQCTALTSTIQYSIMIHEEKKRKNEQGVLGALVKMAIINEWPDDVLTCPKSAGTEVPTLHTLLPNHECCAHRVQTLQHHE